MIARALAWKVASGLMADRARRFEQGLREQIGHEQTNREAWEMTAGTVAGGPFAGLSYQGVVAAEVDAAAAKLTGVYEHDIADVFVPGRYTTFVDVGCADGYYAAGFAFANPLALVHAFDIAPSARRVCRAVCARNGVADRVRVGKRFDLRTARDLDLDDALVLIDIEGNEAGLVDEAMAREFRSSIVVIEVHEHMAPGVSGRLRSVFSGSHSIRQVEATAPVIPEPLKAWPEEKAREALSEVRSAEMFWFVCEPAG